MKTSSLMVWALVSSSILASHAGWAAPKAAKVEAPTPVTSVSAPSAEDWKGPADTSVVGLGVLTGLGILDAKPGYALLGTASYKILRNGFIPDITDNVSIETEVGPLFTQGSTAVQYSLHLRWDFQKDATWTFYGLGGVGGDFTPSSLGSRFIMLPRFGVGAFYKFNDLFLVRAEVSHELTALGVTFPFWL